MTEMVPEQERYLVALCGDWHGNVRWAVHVLHVLGARGIKRVLHVGDFGIWPGDGGKRYLEELAAVCNKYKMSIWVTPGNHEDYTQIEDPEDPDGGTEKQVLRHGHGWSISLLPRGYTWEESGRKIVSFGGAPSIDFQMRSEGKDWWPEEMIRDSDLKRLEGRAEGADLMLTHDAPDGGTKAVQDIIDTPPGMSMWSEAGLTYAMGGRMQMNCAVDVVNPKMFVHGHFHVADDRVTYVDTDQDRTYISLNCDGAAGNVVVLDLITMEYQWL